MNHHLRNSSHFGTGQPEVNAAPQSYSVNEEKQLRKTFEEKPNKTQQNNHQKSTGLKGNYTLMRLPYHNRIEQMQPDGMHTLADFLSHILDLLVGTKDTRNLRLCEKSHNRFPETWPQEISATSVDQAPPRKKQKRSHNTESLPPAPWTLSKANITEADRRACEIRYPRGTDITPGPHFTKPWTLRTMNSKLQFVKTGALQWCIKGMLPSQQETTLFTVLDVIKRLTCPILIAADIPKLQEDTHLALSLLERDFPLTLQNLVTHLIHHIADGLPDNGPMYGRWLFPYERANGWMTRQGLKKGQEEATIMETYTIYDWCVYMMISQKMSPTITDTSSVRSAADFVRSIISTGYQDKANIVTTFGVKECFPLRDTFFNSMRDFYITLNIPVNLIPSSAVRVNSVEIQDRMLSQSVRFCGTNSGKKTHPSIVELKGNTCNIQFGMILYIVEHCLPHYTFYWAVIKRLKNCRKVDGVWQGRGFETTECLHFIDNLKAPLVTSVNNDVVYILNRK